MQTGTRGQVVVATIGFGLIGLGLGWLIGMSLEPVIQNVIGQFLAIVILLLATVSGLEKKVLATPESILSSLPKSDLPADQPPTIATVPQKVLTQTVNSLGAWYLNPLPLAMVLTGMIIGTSAGNYARAHNSLGIEVAPIVPLEEAALKAEVKMWESVGISGTVTAQRLFALKYPVDEMSDIGGTDQPNQRQPNSQGTGFSGFGFDMVLRECNVIVPEDPENLDDLVLGRLDDNDKRTGGLGQDNEQLLKLFNLLNTLDNSNESFREAMEILCTPTES